MFEDFSAACSTPVCAAPPFGAMPRVDVSETNSEYEVKAELPGLEEKDINLQLANNVLNIRGEKKAEREEKDKNYYLAERSFGSFQRSIPLPTEVEEDRVQASFKSGVLTVRLPKSERAKSQAKRIEVKPGLFSRQGGAGPRPGSGVDQRCWRSAPAGLPPRRRSAVAATVCSSTTVRSCILECLRAGIWGTKNTWGRIVSYKSRMAGS